MKILDYLQELNSYTISKYNPVTPNLTWNKYDVIARTVAPVIDCLNDSIAVVNQNGWDINVRLYNHQSRNNNLSHKIYTSLINKKCNDLITTITKHTRSNGIAFITLNSRLEPICLKPDYLAVYYDEYNQVYTKIHPKKDGVINTSINLLDDNSLYIIKEPNTEDKALGSSRIDGAYHWVVLYNTILNHNIVLAERGGVGKLYAIFEKEFSEALNEEVTENNKKITIGQRFLNRLFEFIRGSDTPAIYASGLKDVKEFLKTNKDMQYIELLDKCEQQISRAFGLTHTTSDTKYSNAQTFNYQAYDKFGRQIQDKIAVMFNTWLLPKFGVETSENLQFVFNELDDPDKQAKDEFMLNVMNTLVSLSDNTNYRAQIVNEFRDRIGISELPLNLFESTVQAQTQIEGFKKKSKSLLDQFFDGKTPTEKALESDAYIHYEADKSTKKRVKKGFLGKLEAAVALQLQDAAKQIKNSDSTEYKLKPLETYYSFNSMESDLLRFTEPVIIEVKARYKALKGEELETFAKFTYPQSLINLVKERVNAILNGNDTFAAVDVTTEVAITALIEENIGEGLDAVLQAISLGVQSISERRAELIAQGTVASIVEESRYTLYSQEAGFTVKRTLTALDANVTDICRQNAVEGIIPINQPHKSGEQVPPNHFGCRSTEIYGFTAEDIS